MMGNIMLRYGFSINMSMLEEHPNFLESFRMERHKVSFMSCGNWSVHEPHQGCLGVEQNDLLASFMNYVPSVYASPYKYIANIQGVRYYTCNVPSCKMVVATMDIACCSPCWYANEEKYEIDKHSSRCEERQAWYKEILGEKWPK